MTKSEVNKFNSWKDAEPATEGSISDSAILLRVGDLIRLGYKIENWEQYAWAEMNEMGRK